MDQRKVILITGSVGTGKTTFLMNMSTLLRKRWAIDGFLSLPTRRPIGINKSAESYNLKFLKESSLIPWATKKVDGFGFDFDQNTIELVESRLLSDRALRADVMVLDDLGFLEVNGEGFATLFEKVLFSNEKTIVVSVKKEAVLSFIEKFRLSDYIICDLDEVKGKDRKKFLYRELNKLDGEDIGIFSTINGVTEVTFGSTLHAMRFPLKGHILVGLQNFFLVLFGKELKGRGIFWISLISACMKSFSPAGGRLKPMIYIFLQGVCFSFPVSIFGWNFVSALVGSMLMQIASLCFKFLSAYFIFGTTVFDSYLNGINRILSFLSLPSVSLLGVLLFLLLSKLIVGLFVVVIGYSFDFSKLLFRWRHRVARLEDNCEAISENNSWKQAMLGGLRDMILKRFLLPFIFTLMIIYFFSNLSIQGITSVTIRAFVLSWIAFVISRRINYQRIIGYLNRKELGHIARAMESAVRTVTSFRKR